MTPEICHKGNMTQTPDPDDRSYKELYDAWIKVGLYILYGIGVEDATEEDWQRLKTAHRRVMAIRQYGGE